MGVSRETLRRLEQGDPGVVLNTPAMALSAFSTGTDSQHVIGAKGDLNLMVIAGTVSHFFDRAGKARRSRLLSH